MEDLARRLMSWIKEQVTGADCRGTVVGLSGGIDSSVVAVLSHHAFPGNALAVLMPCHSNREDLDDARLLARTFSIPTVTVALDRVFDSLLEALPKAEYDPDTLKLAEANLKPRLRMSTLYYYANRLHYLVAGTCNKSEIAVGYATKYGDSGADILPLGNLLKGEVRELAACLGIPGSIIEKAPSAGLWEGQTDEGEMGITYEELDSYLATGQATGKVRKRVDALAKATLHKRTPPPVPPY
ncbi:MAG: NAD(+) synthase [Dehalococcoidia bacterium]